jgi:hypothetical protein
VHHLHSEKLANSCLVSASGLSHMNFERPSRKFQTQLVRQLGWIDFSNAKVLPRKATASSLLRHTLGRPWDAGYGG